MMFVNQDGIEDFASPHTINEIELLEQKRMSNVRFEVQVVNDIDVNPRTGKFN
jgi:hypothetical protein